MAGAGKTEAANFFKEKGMKVLRFGSVIDEGLKAEGLSWSPENNAFYREKIRKELGMEAVAIKMMPKIEEALEMGEIITLDGLYSWEEYLYLKNRLSNLFLLCIYAAPSVRYTRLAERKERTWSQKEARQRDISEIEKTNKGGPIALADYLIKNETTKGDLYKELERFMEIVDND